jgi:hypothetical protein
MKLITGRRGLVVLAGVAGAMVLMAAACGGNSAAPGVAKAPTGTESSTPSKTNSPPSGDAHALSRCMRAHGVPNFPDPDSQGRLTLQGGPGTGLDPNSSQFQAAQKACRKYAPNGGRAPSPAEQAKAEKAALAFSSCMRSHGVRNFPDPQVSGGGIRIGIKPSSGIDPNSPVFQAAQKACQTKVGGPGGGFRTSTGP